MKKILFFCIVALFTCINANAQRVQRHENGLYGLAITKNNGSVKWVAKPKYMKIQKNTSDSWAVCNENGMWGIVLASGRETIPCSYNSLETVKEAYTYKMNPSAKTFVANAGADTRNINNLGFTLDRDYTSYIKEYVESKVNEWQKKGEFEKTAAYQMRVSEQNRQAMIKRYTKEVCEECLRKASDKKLKMVLKDYDADNETFLVASSVGSFVLPIPLKDAPQFKAQWGSLNSLNEYDIVNGRIKIKSVRFLRDDKEVARYNGDTGAMYAQTNIQYNFDPITVDLGKETGATQPNVAQTTIKVGKSDVDMNVPTATAANNNVFAVVIANEDYREEVRVNYAKNDGESVTNYLRQTLGLPQTNIHFVANATKNDMIRELDWLKSVAAAYGNGVDVMVYYAGHGVPSEKDGSAYLVPIDGVGSNPKTLYSLSEFYKELGDLTTGKKMVFIDACFSGSTRGKGMLTAARGVALKVPRQAAAAENMIVFTAAQGDETAWPYDEMGHGLFTYFLLKKIKDSKGAATMGQIFDYVKEEVGKHSVVVNSKRQTPAVNVSSNLSSTWNSIKIANSK